MAIEQNEGTTASAPSPQKPAESATGFAGATLNDARAPGGSADFLSLTANLGLTRIDATVEPYLTEMMKAIKNVLPDAILHTLETLSNSYAVMYVGPDGVQNFFGLQFVQASDPVSPKFFPQSVKFRAMKEDIQRRFGNKPLRLSDARILLAGYGPDMERHYEMANTIVKVFQVTSVNDVKNAQITSLMSNEFVADWRISEVKTMEQNLSPHGIRPRLDIGMTLKVKIKSDMGREFREFDADYRDVGVIGGYTEVREREEFVVNNQRVLLYQPVFNITVCNSVIPLEGMFGILLAAFAPTIYNTYFWAKQWSELGEGKPQPGLLEENPDNRGKPIILKDSEELHDFVKTYFAKPIIAFHFQDGRDNIPGVMLLSSSDQDSKTKIMNRLTNFFDIEATNIGNTDLARQVEMRYDGAYGDVKGTLFDSRYIDFLQIAAQSGVSSIDRAMREILIAATDVPEDRARLISQFTNSFVPLWLNTVAVVNPDFIKWLVDTTKSKHFTITDPNAQSLSARPFGSVLEGFGSSAGIGSIVSNGAVARGYNLSSFWS